MKHTTPAGAATTDVIKLAVLAVGGQGGGVLTNWILTLAEGAGWWAQATSVAGVAQRTGATIYYVEMTPPDAARPDRAPVLALSPAPGDVDILIAAELAESGRAVLRGFVTPDRTTLIASTHRMLAVSEKIAPGDGRADAATLLAEVKSHCARLVAFDMEAVARDAGAVVSASLFGALAGSGVLPFPRAAFEAAIRASGRGVEPSLAAFRAAAVQAAETAEVIAPAPAVAPAPPEPEGPAPLAAAWRALEARLAGWPPPVAAMAALGLRKVVDYQDLAYGAEYLDRVKRALAAPGPGEATAFAEAAAKHLANAMAYDDILRVADLKTRAARSARVRAETGAGDGQRLTVTEYFHPRMAEVAATLPATLGAWVSARPGLMRALDRVVDRGRRIRTDRPTGFALLWLVAGLRQHRRRLLRHQTETAHLEAWFATALAARARDPALGVEVLNCRRLVKGYSDTHARGLSKFDRVLGALPLLEGRPDAADWLRRLREAALRDPDGEAVDGAIRTVESFAQPGRGDAPT